MPGDSMLYLVVLGCPFCGEEVQLVEEFDQPIGAMQDVPVSAEFCPECGEPVDSHDGWDLREESVIERVAISDGGEGVECPVCENPLYPHEHTLWCDECEREYWEEGDGWWRCGLDGEPERVAALAGDAA